MSTTVQEQLEQSVGALMALSDSELELELGRRLTQSVEEATLRPTGGASVDRATLQDLPPFVRTVAQRFLDRFNRQMYSLICDQNDPDNAKLRFAASEGIEKLGYVLSGALVVTFGWMPGIASVIAVIIVKRIAKSGYGAFCETWKEKL